MNGKYIDDGGKFEEQKLQKKVTYMEIRADQEDSASDENEETLPITVEQDQSYFEDKDKSCFESLHNEEMKFEQSADDLFMNLDQNINEYQIFKEGESIHVNVGTILNKRGINK